MTTTITLDKEVKSRYEEAKPDDMTWNMFMNEVIDVYTGEETPDESTEGGVESEQLEEVLETLESLNGSSVEEGDVDTETLSEINEKLESLEELQSIKAELKTIEDQLTNLPGRTVEQLKSELSGGY